MAETPVIVSHNVLSGAVITGDSREGYPLWRIVDGLRWTWWEAVSSSTHYIYVLVKNLLLNGDFEVSTEGWFIQTNGAGDGSFSRNTANPIDGEADGFIDVTTADSGINKVIVTSLKSYLLKKGGTYRFSFAAKADATRSLRYGFAVNDLTEESSYSDEDLGAGVTELYEDFTPTADGEYRVFWRPLEPGGFYVDDVHLCEVRDVDTIVFDRGHTLQGYIFEVKKADTAYSDASFTVWHPNTMIVSDQPVYSTYDIAKRGVQWKIKIEPAGLPGLPAPQITLAWIGRRWELPRNFTGKFDPHALRTFSHVIRGERGIEARTRRFSQRIFDGALRNIDPADYEDIERFMTDTDNGTLPFVFLWRPAGNATDLLVMRLDREGRSVPYDGGHLRNWPFRAVELTGARKL